VKKFLLELPNSVKMTLLICFGVAFLTGAITAISGFFVVGMQLMIVLFIGLGSVFGGIVYGVSKGHIE
jgi:hypothetical protein